MSDGCKTITIVVDIQENGIIRTVSGSIIGHLINELPMEVLAANLREQGLNIITNSKGAKIDV